MTSDGVIALIQQMLALAVILAGPILGAGLAIGLIVAVFQAATQIQESALAFVPKLIAMGFALAFFGHWLLNKILIFITTMFHELSFVGPSGGIG